MSEVHSTASVVNAVYMHYSSISCITPYRKVTHLKLSLDSAAHASGVKRMYAPDVKLMLLVDCY